MPITVRWPSPGGPRFGCLSIKFLFRATTICLETRDRKFSTPLPATPRPPPPWNGIGFWGSRGPPVRARRRAPARRGGGQEETARPNARMIIHANAPRLRVPLVTTVWGSPVRWISKRAPSALKFDQLFVAGRPSPFPQVVSEFWRANNVRCRLFSPHFPRPQSLRAWRMMVLPPVWPRPGPPTAQSGEKLAVVPRSNCANFSFFP